MNLLSTLRNSRIFPLMRFSSERASASKNGFMGIRNFKKNISKTGSTLTICVSILLLASGCAKSNRYPEITAELKHSSVSVALLKNALQDPQKPNGEDVDTGEASRSAKITEVTVSTESIINRPFLYGSTLQESSVFETAGEAPIDIPAINLGLFPAKFEIFGNKLRLVSDSAHEFESDINRPSRLIHEFDILKKSKDALTFQVKSSSPILHTFFLGINTSSSVRVSWLRSFDFFQNDQLFLFESAVELSDGSVAFFSESITPREKVVPEGTKAIYIDEELSPGSERFRFLDAGSYFINVDGERVQTKAAQRFLKKENQPIQWWVTPNVPKEYLNDIRNGVEGWNRYAKDLGEEKIVQFMGTLPSGIKIGDPRYNIIVWDNIQEADAAYESQSSDPTTGIQSHSLIYLPLAWVNIGKDYWKNVGKSEKKETKAKLHSFLSKRTVMGKKAPVHCFHSAKKQATLASLSDADFGRKLLKAVLFHEMGHALGLAHNFKGSLSFDPNQPGSPFSTSIMDYNQYNEEVDAFFELEGADGPLLEYDRQILSYLYNEGESIKDTDPVVPACSDEEADSKDGGIDPLCLRYDIGSDPTVTAQMSLSLLMNQEAKKGKMNSLPHSLVQLSKQLTAPDELDTEEKLDSSISSFFQLLDGVVGIYISNDVNSLAIALSDAALSLYTERDLLPGYKIEEMRSRTMNTLNQVESMNDLPEASQKAFQNLKSDTLLWMRSSKFAKGISEELLQKKMEKVESDMNLKWSQIQSKHFLRLKSRIAATLQYSDEAPFSFHEENNQEIDLEKYVVQKLENLFLNTPGSWNAKLDLRMKSVKALARFPNGSKMDTYAKVRAQIETEIQKSSDAREREALRKLLEELK